ncbi:MAG: site-specific integrase, partial [Nitrospirota bacterium]
AFDMKLDRNSSSTVSLSEVEVIQLLNELRKHKTESQKSYRDYLLVTTMLTTSLRIAEVLQMDVSFIRSDNITGQSYMEIIQKKNRVRKVLIPQKLLEEYMEYAGKHEIKGPVFTNIKNNVSESMVLTQKGSYKIIKGLVEKYLNKSGIGNHSLRKSFIELANKRRISPVSIMKATGHSTLQMIKYYDTTDELSDNASSDIAKVLLE